MRVPATALLTVALTVGASGAPATASPPDWHVTGVRPIGQPIAVGGVAVGYLTRDRRLYARAMRPADGTTIWEREITPSRQTAGMAIVPARVGDGVALLEPRPDSGPNWASLTVVEAATGRVVRSSPPAIFRTTAYGCHDDSSACAMSVPHQGGTRREYRLDLATGAFTPHGAEVPRARSIGEAGLTDLGDRPNERIALIRDGAVRWQRPVADAFPTGFSTDNGWTWWYAEQAGVYAGSVFGPARRTANTVDLELHTQTASAGLDEQTGAVLWRDAGSMTSCAYSIALRDEAVRCRVRGTAHFVVSPPSESFTDLDVVLEGFDPRTGATRWTLPAGAAEALVSFSQPAAVAGEHTIVAGLPAGDREIDLRDGTVTEPAADARYWCLSRARFDFHEGYTAGDGPERFDRTGDNLATVCTADGGPADSGRPSPGASQAIGAVVNGYAVVATADGYHGVTLTG
ncbi:hypothetical protein [Actinoplanes subglobosus]|uniref:Pyrroloquinoline-quinone binding quinoprotein n=1 Tax=Actinoplanes subglobosus TaxID=1547892 RepID=A0ABV8IST8_9ACTN